MQLVHHEQYPKKTLSAALAKKLVVIFHVIWLFIISKRFRLSDRIIQIGDKIPRHSGIQHTPGGV